MQPFLKHNAPHKNTGWQACDCSYPNASNFRAGFYLAIFAHRDRHGTHQSTNKVISRKILPAKT